MPAVRSAKPAAPNDDKRWRIVETRMRRLGNRPDALVEALHSAQEAFGYIDDDALRFVSDTLSVPPSKVYRRRDLLSLLHAQAPGRAHVRRVHRHRLLHQRSRGASSRPSSPSLGIKPRETTSDGKVSLLTAPLPGCLQPGARGDRRRRGRGQGRRGQVRGTAGGTMSDLAAAATPERPATDDESRDHPRRARSARRPTSARP